MLFEKYKPSKKLAHLIAYFWTLKSSESDVSDGTYRFVPDAYVDWVFHIGTPWQCNFPDTVHQSKTGRFHVFGQIKKHINLTLPNGDLEVFGVKFHPWVANKIWNIDMHYLTNSCLDLMQLELPYMKDLQEKICLSGTVNDQIQLIENYLQTSMDFNDNESLKPMFSKLEMNKQLLINCNVGISLRRLQQRFKDEIGISPKLFLRTLRINAIIEQMKLKPKQSLTQLALEYNYFDQTHFIKDFKHFTGLKPTHFLKSINPNGDILNLRVN